jgi:hypothetical protein
MISLRKVLFALAATVVVAMVVSHASSAFAQPPSSQQQVQQPPPAAAAPPASADSSATLRDSEPSRTLRDALAAACEESETSFGRFLTAANAEAFAHLAPERRVALMKRLVLLDAPGRPEGVANPSGRPVLRCTALGATSEMRLGGGSVRENLAFIPVEVRALGDSAEDSPRRVTFGLVREDGGWKLLSVGLLLLDLPALEQQWDLAEVEENEAAVIANLRKIAAAIRTYRDAWGRFPQSLANLGPAGKEGASPETANLLDAQTASGTIEGYSYRYVILPVVGAQTERNFEVAATPLIYGKTGRKSFLLDARGALHGADKQGAPASDSDPRVTRRWRSDNTGEFSLTKPRIERENEFTLPFANGCAPGLHSGGNLASKGRRTLNLPEPFANDKRGAPRYPLIASADVIEVETGASFSAQTSDISRTGCYIDMLNPSAQGTQLRVIIKNGDDVFEATARVIFTVPGLGMGVAFLRVAPQHEAVLTKWIAELAV